MTVVRTLVLAVIVAATTWVAGWWTVPICGAVYALLRRGSERVTSEAAIAAMLAWSALLAFQVANPAFSRLSAAIGGAIPAPTIVLLLLAVLFAGALAGSAAHLLRDR